MSCSLGTYPSTRQVAPAAPANALRAAAERLQTTAASGTSISTRPPNYLLDVPVSAIDVDRWERRWQEAKDTSSTAASSSFRTAGVFFQSASVAYAARFSTATGNAAAGVEYARSPTHHLAPLPSFVFASVKTLPMTQLLKLRRQWLPHRQRFPLHQQRMGFLDAVLNYAVVALVGPSGSGRTLQVPIVLSETEVLKRRRLVVVSANATSARLTALRLREERGEDVQSSRTVAAAVPNLIEVNESTSVVVTTAEVLLRQLLCDPFLEDIGCVVLDDVHLRNESTELCLALLRDLLSVQQQAEQRQQQQQLQNTGAGSGAAVGEAGATGGADATRRLRRLHVVLNCPDEANAATLLSFLASARCKATTFTLQASSALLTASTTLYLEETVQWLLKCEKEGSCVVRDGGASGGTVESALLPYAENVDAVARVMAAVDADFAQPAGFWSYWFPLIRECVDHYDRADRQARSSGDAGDSSLPASPLPAILVVAPDNYHVHVIAKALQETQRHAAEEDPAARRVLTALADDAPFENFVTTARRTAVKDANQRWVVVATNELSQTVLPSNVDVGLVVDCARSTYTPVDAATMADTCTTEYSSITQLRYRRRLAKVTTMDGSGGGTHHHSLTPVVVQLIPKSVLHSAQHRRLNADPAQHIIFRLPFHRYVQLYQVLQAREEALVAQRAAVAASLGGSLHGSTGTHSGGESGLTVAAKISNIITALLIGVPAATANKYETVRRVMTSVEVHLRASAHLAVESEAGSIHSGRLVLQPMGVLSLCMPVPFSVARLLVAGALLHPSFAALTAVGALWCCSNLLSLQGVGAVRVADAASDAARESMEEQEALLGEARLFFSRDSLSDVVAAFHVYQMWCSVRAKPEAERDFLEECGVSQDVLATVFETQLGLCAMLRSFGMLVAPPGSDGSSSSSSTVDRAESAEERALRACIVAFDNAAEASARLRDALAAAMTALPQEVSSSRVLHACVTAALYPSCVVPTGENGVGLLYDTVGAGAVGAEAGNAGATFSGLCVASFAQDSLLADAGQAAKAAGRPFVFLAKAVADDVARETAGGAPAVSATVVELLNPLHEAAALVFCGHSYERPRKAPLRCRGWSSVLTKSWRETRRARGLPPVAQLPPTSIVVQSYDTVHCQQVVCTVDHGFSLTMRSTASRWLQHLRTHVRSQLAALVRGNALSSSTVEALSAYQALAAEMAEAWAWWERRHAQGKEWLREERVVVAHQQESDGKDGEGGTEEEAAAASTTAAKAAALRQQLYGYYEWLLQPGAPVAVVVPTNADRRAAARSAAARSAAAVAATATSSDAPVLETKAADEDNEESARDAEAGGLPATYTGKLPPADVDHIFRQCAKSMAAKGTREAEARLLRDSPDMFSFLNPEDPYHEYYLYLLRQAAPDMEVLGDNLEELISFLENLEVELREELGITDAAAADANDTNNEDDIHAGRGVLGEGEPSMWSTTAGMYEVHDVVEGEGGEEAEDLYAGDGGGGLQLESAVVNLKKNAGPTLAEQIEQARRAQVNPQQPAKSENSNSSNAAAAMVGAAAAAGSPNMMSSPSSEWGNMHGGAVASTANASSPFVSTNAGETLADKLKAMQMAAMQQGSSSTAAGGGVGGSAAGAVPSANAFYAGGDADNTGGAQADFVVPQPTTEDLLAAINFGSDGAATDFAPTTLPPGQPAYDFSGGVANSSVFQAPTTEELMALLGSTAPSPPFPDMGAGSVLGVLGTPPPGPSVLPFSMPLMNPLSRPPPALPAKALEERPPSVLIYPIPNCRNHGGNVRLLLAKSLGEALNMRVGPTLIVGRVARIDVPNRNVEARALALKKFQCAEQTVYLLRNDRVIDDPAREKREQRERRAERDRKAAAYYVSRRHRSETAELATTAAVDPISPDTLFDPSAYAAGSPPAAVATEAPASAAFRLGVLSSSEDEDDDDSDDSSSASSSSSSVE
ncbi:hypothetical protein N2W54_003291 [Lotmaria passim]